MKDAEDFGGPRDLFSVRARRLENDIDWRRRFLGDQRIDAADVAEVRGVGLGEVLVLIPSGPSESPRSM